MRVLRWLPIVMLCAIGSVAHAEAAIITVDVAQVTWTVEGDSCTITTPDDCNTVFTLLYLWTVGGSPGPSPEPTVSGSLDVDGTPIAFLDVDGTSPVDIVSFAAFGLPGGVPASASAVVSFNFLGPRSIGPQGLVPATDLFTANGTPSLGVATVFSFEYDDSPTSVPEPGSLALLAIGLLTAQRRSARARRF